jgi:hypothetical protein
MEAFILGIGWKGSATEKVIWWARTALIKVAVVCYYFVTRYRDLEG